MTIELVFGHFLCLLWLILVFFVDFSDFIGGIVDLFLLLISLLILNHSFSQMEEASEYISLLLHEKTEIRAEALNIFSQILSEGDPSPLAGKSFVKNLINCLRHQVILNRETLNLKGFSAGRSFECLSTCRISSQSPFSFCSSSPLVANSKRSSSPMTFLQLPIRSSSPL